jgi:hypothetical protein
MHRVLGTWDFCISVEVHVDTPPTPMSALGGSAWTLEWLDAWSKKAPKVEMGSLGVNPLGMGHDCGPGRLHVLVTIAPPAPWTSIGASALATAMASCKPQFNAHKTQAGVPADPAGTDALPVTAEPIPFVGIVIGTVCGSPVNTPASLPLPLIPTQLSVFTGMTWGDIVAGIVNIAVDMALSFALGKLGGAIGKKFEGEILEQIIPIILPGLSVLGKILHINLDVSIDNPGRVVQEWVDGDGVTSDARTGGRVVGFGGQGRGAGSGPDSGARPVGPWNA